MISLFACENVMNIRKSMTPLPYILFGTPTADHQYSDNK